MNNLSANTEMHSQARRFEIDWRCVTAALIAGITFYVAAARTPEEVQALEARAALDQCKDDQERMWATPDAAVKQAKKCEALARALMH